MRTSRVLTSLLLLGSIAAAACEDVSDPGDDSVFEPTEPLLLSSGSPTKDEDPSVLRAQDGTMFVAWFSDRGGNADIYITSTRDGKEWTSPVRITSAAGGDFNPHLIQDDQGTFHLTWFRWEAFFRGAIWYNSSTDGLTWNQSAEVRVTTGADVDDWVPTITRAADGTLLVYFVSDKRDAANPTSEIYVATKRPTDSSWTPAAPVAGVNSATLHDHLPFAARTGDQISLAWVRFDTTEPLPWLNHKSDVFHATSSDGLVWSTPLKLTNEAGNVVNLFPGMYRTLGGAWSFIWLSTRAGPPRVLVQSLEDAGRYPQGVVENTLLPEGYSHRVAATSTPGVYLGVWVQGADGVQDIHYRFFRR
jgi:hypothetical protein